MIRAVETTSSIQLSDAFWALFEATGGATVLVDPATMKVVKANLAFCQWSGYSVEELEGKHTIMEFMPPEDVPVMKEQFKKRVMGDPTVLNEFEMQGMTRSGKIEECRVFTRVIEDPRLIVYTVTDIGPVKENVRKEAHYKTLMESCGTGIAVLNADLSLSYVNPTFEEITGYSSAEALSGMKVTEMLTPESVEIALQRIQKRLKNDPNYTPSAEMTGVRKDGELRNVLTMTKELQDSDQLLISFVDITRRKAAEDKLALRLRREAMLNQITSTLIDVSEFNLETKFQMALELIRREFGAAAANLFIHDEKASEKLLFVACDPNYEAIMSSFPARADEWQTLCALSAPTDLAQCNEWLDGLAVIQKEVHKTKTRLFYILPHQSGTIRHTLILEDQENRTWGSADLNMLDTLSVVFDTVMHKVSAATRHQRIEEQLQQTQKLDSIGVLSSGIAHDFNNILATMLGNAELTQDILLESGMDTDTVDDLITAGRRGRDLTQQILDFARGENCELKTVVISDVCKEALRLFRPTIPSSIETAFTTAEICDDCVHGDETQMLQVVLNLCTNAFQAMGETGSLRVHLANVQQAEVPSAAHLGDSETFLKMSVTDTGPGIEDEICKKIFDPFFTTRSDAGGTGMGLSVVHGIVAANGGTITIDTKIGVGTTFHVFLPLAAANHKGLSHDPQATPAPPAERILVVDDETSILRVMRSMLTAAGYEVVALSCGAEAIKQFEQDPDAWDLVLTDMIMPIASGRDVAEAVRAKRPELPIVLCSGYSAPSQLMTAEPDLFAAFLQKPFERADLLTLIGTIIKTS